MEHRSFRRDKRKKLTFIVWLRSQTLLVCVVTGAAEHLSSPLKMIIAVLEAMALGSVLGMFLRMVSGMIEGAIVGMAVNMTVMATAPWDFGRILGMWHLEESSELSSVFPYGISTVT
jgi:hypothetical protein